MSLSSAVATVVSLVAPSSIETARKNEAKHRLEVERLRESYSDNPDAATWRDLGAAEEKLAQAVVVCDGAERRERARLASIAQAERDRDMAELRAIAEAHNLQQRLTDGEIHLARIVSATEQIRASFDAIDQMEQESRVALVRAIELEQRLGVAVLERSFDGADPPRHIAIAGPIRHMATNATQRARSNMRDFRGF